MKAPPLGKSVKVWFQKDKLQQKPTSALKSFAQQPVDPSSPCIVWAGVVRKWWSRFNFRKVDVNTFSRPRGLLNN